MSFGRFGRLLKGAAPDFVVPQRLGFPTVATALASVRAMAHAHRAAQAAHAKAPTLVTQRAMDHAAGNLGVAVQHALAQGATTAEIEAAGRIHLSNRSPTRRTPR